MSRGHAAAWDQQWDRAIAFYRAALTEFPDETGALTALGFALLQAERLDDALSAYQRAASLLPGDPMAPEKCGEIFERLGRSAEAAQTYLVVGEIHLQRRDLPKAIDNWVRVVGLAPDNLGARSRLALALERSGQARAAAAEYVEVARLFQHSGQVEKAGQALARALQLEPQLPAARQASERLQHNVPIRAAGGSGLARRQTGLLTPLASAQAAAPAAAPAEPAGALASPLDAARDTALAGLAELLLEVDADTSRVALSMSALTGGAASVRDSENTRAQAVMSLGQALSAHTAGNVEAAASQLAAAYEIGLDHPLLRFMLADQLMQLRRPSEALEHFEAAVARDDIRLGVLYGLAEASRQTQKMRAALMYYLEALKQLDLSLAAPESRQGLADAYEGLAESLNNAGETDAAAVLPGLRRSLSGEDWEARARQTRQRLDAAAQGGPPAALAEELVSAPGSDEVIASMHRIDEYVGRQRYAAAMEEAYWAINHAPTYLPLHVRMAEILVAEHRLEPAALKYRVVANTYRVRGEAGRAAQMLGQVLKLNPVDLEARQQLVALLVDQGKTEDALAQYVDLAETYRDLADLDATRGQYEAALRYAQSAGARSWSVRLLHAICDLDMQTLAWRDAVRGYQQIQALAPDDAKARIALVDLYLRLGNTRQAVAELDAYLNQLINQRALPSATALLEELLSNHPDDPALVARLARLYADQGRRAEALARYDQLGDIQLKDGQNDQAVATIRIILALGPDDPAPYQQLLAQLQP